jgi:cell division protein ZapA (FtsZ GTPase activity inhibitor)
VSQGPVDADLAMAMFRFQEKDYSVVCLGEGGDLRAAEGLLEKTFRDMEDLYESQCKCSPSALDSSAWLLMGALNLAHRVVRLEREADAQTRDLEERLSKLLEEVPDDACPADPQKTH